MTFDVRAITIDELGAMRLAAGRGFGEADDPAHDATWERAELDRTRVAFDDGRIVGVSRAFSFDLTMPGGACVPAAAVSDVAVLPTDRRRGALRELITALHADARERGEPVAVLTASEDAIYGRFGYGPAAWHLGVVADRATVGVPGEGGPGSMRLVERNEADVVLPAVYEKVRRTRAGMVSRPSYWWPTVFWRWWKRKDEAFFVAVHRDERGEDDGYVAYEIGGAWHGGLADRQLTVTDMQATDGSVRADLWRYVFGVDLVRTVRAGRLPVDDPIRHVASDRRRIRVDFLVDGMMLAPLDPVAALAARTYAVPGAVTIEVHAPDGGPAVVALDGGPDGATATRASAAPDIVCSTAVLGSCLLGGVRWSELAQAGLLGASADPRTLARADAMFATSPAPALLGEF